MINQVNPIILKYPTKVLAQLKEFWADGKWSGPKLRNVLILLGVPIDVIEEIEGIPIESGGKDTLRWTRSAHRDFFTSSAWDLCRHRQPQMPVFKLI